jgi:polysaccharide export outer membrane protein
MKHGVNVILLGALTVVVGACSHRPPAASDAEVYNQQALGTFLKETTPDELQNEYVVGAGDHLKVTFFYHDELTSDDLLVRPDGRITLPYVGDIMAAGNTPMHLDSLLEARFATILRQPSLSVIVRSIATPIVYVLGEVQLPDGYGMHGPVSVAQAIALARGLKPGAKADHTLVIRRQGTSRIIAVEVDLKAILSGKAIGNDFLLRNYDIVYVPKTRLKSAAEVMTILNDVIRPPTDLFLRGWQVQVLRTQIELLRQDQNNP